MRKQVDELFSANIIRKSNSEYASTGLLVNKKGADKRPVIDYRALNKITEKHQISAICYRRLY